MRSMTEGIEAIDYRRSIDLPPPPAKIRDFCHLPLPGGGFSGVTFLLSYRGEALTGVPPYQGGCFVQRKGLPKNFRFPAAPGGLSEGIQIQNRRFLPTTSTATAPIRAMIMAGIHSSEKVSPVAGDSGSTGPVGLVKLSR